MIASGQVREIARGCACRAARRAASLARALPAACLVAACAVPPPAPAPAAPADAAAVPGAVAVAIPVSAAPLGAAPGVLVAAAGAAPVAPGEAAPAPPARGPDASLPRPFDDVVRDAQESPGFFTVWQKEEKVWLEIRADQVGVPFFLSAKLASGLGEQRFLPGLHESGRVVVLRRIGNQLQLIGRNLAVRAAPDTPLAGAIADSFSDSLLAAAPLASQVRSDGKSFLVDAATLLGADIPGLQSELEGAFHVPYAYDARNSSFERVRSDGAATSLTLRAHYAVAKLPPAARPPRGLPDPRSLFLDLGYVMAPLPAVPMKPRRADQRIGHFTTSFWDLDRDSGGETRTHYVERWRLEKRDPGAAVSAPREPIVVWMDRNIPERWRDAVRAGILAWSPAFEQAGFSDALEVRQQPPDADWSTLDGTRHVAVRWFAMSGPAGLAVAPHLADPRSGEILEATVILSENLARFYRSAVDEYLPPSLPQEPAAQLCSVAADAAIQSDFALDLLTARGAIAVDSPAAEAFVAAGIQAVVMHEIGHALGLRHNFRASAGVALERLRDPEYVRVHGISNSVMDDNALNIPLDGEAPTAYHQLVLGAYDYWAIDYAYHPFDGADEAQQLAQIAGRAALEPALAYGTDEDAGSAGIDPLINRNDLGDDPLAFYKRSFALARELWTRTERLELPPGASYALYRRNLQRGLRYIAGVAPLIAKYVGGVYTTRDLAGAGRPLLRPVAADKQREALDVLAGDLFSIDSFRFEPSFMSRLGIEYLDHDPLRAGAESVDFNLAAALLEIQRGVLDTLMSDPVAARLADAETKVADPGALLSLAELQQRLAAAIWGELKSGDHVDSLRRDLQREHLRRIASSLLQPASPVAADTRAVQRQVAELLAAQLRRALQNPRLDEITRAHYAESLETLEQALRAPLIKQGP